MSQDQIAADIQDLQRLGYVQELLRGMGGFSNFALSFSIISILTGATQLYGYGLQHGGPFQISVGWLVVSGFTLTVALAMAELASSYPTAGALYHWSSFLGGRGLGWFTACFNTIGQFAILAGIDYGLALFLVQLLGWPESGTATNIVYFAILLSHAVFNHCGIRVVAWLNDFSATYHIVVVFFILGILLWHGLSQPPSFLLNFSQTDGYRPGYSFLIGLLLAQWTLTGYDASAHVSEETVNPRLRAPWGIFFAVAVSVVMGFLMLAVVTLAIPNLEIVQRFGDGAFVGLMRLRLGPFLGNGVAGLIAGAMWLCGLASVTSASRMVYAFARDGGLPFSRVWARVSPRHRTPANAIWGLTALAVLLVLSIRLYSAVISIATIALYISYGLPILARLFVRWRGGRDEAGPWTLGRWSTPVAVVAVLWILFISVVFVLPPNGQAGVAIAIFFAVTAGLWRLRVRHHFKGPKYQP